MLLIQVNGASRIRYGAATHAPNNALRRTKHTLVSQSKASDKKYILKIPSEAGVTLPEYWMLCVLQGRVPRRAETVQICPSDGLASEGLNTK